jgi:hypothetical protein
MHACLEVRVRYLGQAAKKKSPDDGVRCYILGVRSTNNVCSGVFRVLEYGVLRSTEYSFMYSSTPEQRVIVEGQRTNQKSRYTFRLTYFIVNYSFAEGVLFCEIKRQDLKCLCNSPIKRMRVR